MTFEEKIEEIIRELDNVDYETFQELFFLKEPKIAISEFKDNPSMNPLTFNIYLLGVKLGLEMALKAKKVTDKHK